MSTLIVTANPNESSLTHYAAKELGERLGLDVTTAHLAQEGFDPRWTVQDSLVYNHDAEYSEDLKFEQKRVEAADHLVLAFPVYWWSMPALLKGWIDRVLMGKWAFNRDPDLKMASNLPDLTVHLLAIANTHAESFDRHGYRSAYRTQIEEGIIKFSGLHLGRTEFVFQSQLANDTVIRDLDDAVSNIAAFINLG